MTQEHPITPPEDLVDSMWDKFKPRDCRYWPTSAAFKNVITESVQWGADQELEAILELAGASALPEDERYFDGLTVASIRAARRPKPPSLREQAISELSGAYNVNQIDDTTYETIRKALEQLPE